MDSPVENLMATATSGKLRTEKTAVGRRRDCNILAEIDKIAGACCSVSG